MERRPVLVLQRELAFATTVACLIRDHAEPVFATDVGAARALLAHHLAWSALIVEIGLPDGDGLEVLASYRELYPRVPALVLTDRLDAATVNRATELRAAYLVKTEDHSAHVRQFVLEATSPGARVECALMACAAEYAIPNAELDILRRYMLGESRGQIAEARGTSLGTVRKQIENLRIRTRTESIDNLVVRILLGANRE